MTSPQPSALEGEVERVACWTRANHRGLKTLLRYVFRRAPL